MPISSQTEEHLRKLTSMASCPSCGKRSERMEALTSCGHYMCCHCVDKFVLNSDNKCPKCYTINNRSDIKEDIYFDEIIKIGNKLNKLLDNQSSDPKLVKVQTKLRPKNSSSLTDNKSMDKQKNKIVSNEKSLAVEDSEDILSIPDSFDNELFTQYSKSSDNTELVSVILEGLQSNCDPIPVDNGSGDQSKTTIGGLQSSKRVVNSSAQTIQKPRVILQSVSTQYIVSHVSQCVQTDEVITNGGTVVANESSHSCESSNCCFHKFVESIPCNSLKTFLKSLIQLKDSPLEVNQTPNCVPIITETVSKSEDAVSIGHKRVEEPKLPNQTSPTDIIHPISSVDTIPSIITSQLTPTEPNKVPEPKKQNKPKAKRKSTEDKVTTKRSASEQIKSKSKKMKAIESSDEEMDAIPSTEQTKDVLPEKPVVPEVITQIDSSTSQLSGAPEVSARKTKPQIKGPKSRQKKTIESVSEEQKKKPKVYVSSDDEVEEEFKSEELTKTSIENKNKIKTNRKIVENKKELNNAGADTATEDLSTNSSSKQTKPRKQTAKRTGIPGQKASNKNLLKLAEDLAKNSNTENDLASNDETIVEPNQSDDTNQRTKRKSVPKKRFSFEESKNEGKQTEEKPIDSKTIDSGKNSKYKPKPKSKQKQALPLDESVESAFKRPVSPTPSIALSEASTNSSASRNRTSSTERSNKKKVILFSGLDEKQRKKIENVCRELDAEAVNDWSDKVTHLVIALAEDRPKKDMICPRNAKYIKALLHNIWIVGYDWIIDSSRSDRFVDENAYEIKADKTATDRGLPNISRTSGDKLLAKRMVKFEGKFGQLLNDFKSFVEIGGGLVIESEEEFDKRKAKTGSEKLIVVTESVGLPSTQKDGVKYVSKKTFMESISNFNPL